MQIQNKGLEIKATGFIKGAEPGGEPGGEQDATGSSHNAGLKRSKG